MARINKKAWTVAELVWDTGKKISIHMDSNKNTGEAIIWLKTEFGTKRMTGRNITRFHKELNETIASGILSIKKDNGLESLKLAAENKGAARDMRVYGFEFV